MCLWLRAEKQWLVTAREREGVPLGCWGMRWHQKLFYSVGHVQNDLCASMWFTLLIVFFQYIIHFHDALAGYLLLFGQVIDAVSTPVVGYLCDFTSGFCRLGRCKSWHLVGSLYTVFYLQSMCVSHISYGPMSFRPSVTSLCQRQDI